MPLVDPIARRAYEAQYARKRRARLAREKADIQLKASRQIARLLPISIHLVSLDGQTVQVTAITPTDCPGTRPFIAVEGEKYFLIGVTRKGELQFRSDNIASIPIVTISDSQSNSSSIINTNNTANIPNPTPDESESDSVLTPEQRYLQYIEKIGADPSDPESIVAAEQRRRVVPPIPVRHSL